MSGEPRYLEMAPEPKGRPVACSRRGVPAATTIEAAQIATYMREQLGEGAEVCTYADGTVAFGRPGEPKTHVRFAR